MPEPERRSDILQAALRVFAQHGFHKASIKMIAREAGIRSPALIYHYFADKQALLTAIITELSPLGRLPLAQGALDEAMLATPPEHFFRHIAAQVIDLQRAPLLVSVLRVYLSESIRMPEVAEVVAELQQAGIQMLRRYIDHHIAVGTLKPHDARSSARAFIGMMMVNVLGRHIFPGFARGLPEDKAYIDTIVDLFLTGLRREP